MDFLAAKILCLTLKFLRADEFSYCFMGRGFLLVVFCFCFSVWQIMGHFLLPLP